MLQKRAVPLAGHYFDSGPEMPQYERSHTNATASETSKRKVTIFRRARVRQIQFCSHWLRILSEAPGLSACLRAMREFPVFRRTFAAITGYNRPFASLKEAEAAISGYAVDGHANPACAMNLLRTMQVASPSDYAALYCLQPILPRIRTVFDFGGSIGNLFYCYAKYLAFPADLSWTVYDLPANVALGEKIALESGDRRLRFTSDLKEGDGADLLLATGVLHYFEKHLPELIAEFKTKPRYILVNRTPLVDGRPFATVQDAGVFRVACVLHNRGELIQSFSDAGYELVDSWRAAERSLLIPFYPDRSVTAYSGMFFRLRDNQPARYEEKHTSCS